MTMSFNEFKQDFNTRLLHFHARQWSQMGVSISYPRKNPEPWSMDPEALIVSSCSVLRQDQRLFDAMLDWVIENCNFINFSRLKSLTDKDDNTTRSLIKCIAEIAMRHKKHLKWNMKQSPLNDSESLFGKSDTKLTIQNEDPIFKAQGFLRSTYSNRGDATSFNAVFPINTILKIRSLMGISARAEILTYLASNKGGHPSEIARLTGYSQKTIQDALVDMLGSKAITTAKLEGRKITYFLKKSDNDHFHQWISSLEPINWYPLLKALTLIFNKLSTLDEATHKPLFLSSELRELLKSTSPLLSIAGIEGYVVSSSNEDKGADFIESFIREFSIILDHIDPR